MTPPSIAEMARVFGWIGLLSFGGPAAQIALMERELVEERPWLEERSFLRALSLCMLLPGPEAMQLATYCGWRLRGVPGGLLAGLLFVLPGAAIIACLVGLYAAYGDLPLVQSVFLGVKAAVVVIVLQALRNLARRALSGKTDYIIAGLGFVALFALNLPFPLIIATAACWGLLTARADPLPEPPHRPRARPLRTVLTWSAIWLLPLIALSLGGQTLLAEIGWFFAKLAVVTFGGAYAVLAYMTQAVVQEHNWITTAQMIDALGLAETTPGPLILVTQFVAMLTGQIQGGAGLALVAGLVALWATFAPCFLWIFLAAPYLDRIAAQPRLAAALRAISAAVVGVILNLSIWFALHVLFGTVTQQGSGVLRLPLPDPTSFNPRAAAMICTAMVVMWALKQGLGRTLAMLALAGAASHFV
ncbi:chromate efflux transporter [Ruegeria sp. 2012CJ41-6]|uniref:Chromate efflux transporter n=1 Tax=Ruegeria spongiae TaxID=2942209 RepID=A0ABT0Q320_9RHOB|nr:chromate efflux transporter [Ruegeria spongiae]MCL6284276.1 chromate efflux transporter [Ruegeria spongiae]